MPVSETVLNSAHSRLRLHLSRCQPRQWLLLAIAWTGNTDSNIFVASRPLQITDRSTCEAFPAVATLVVICRDPNGWCMSYYSDVAAHVGSGSARLAWQMLKSIADRERSNPSSASKYRFSPCHVCLCVWQVEEIGNQPIR
jgi:hypothetical protein